MATPTIQFDDDVEQMRRPRSRDGGASTTGANLNDGIVFARTVSMGRRHSRSRSGDKLSRTFTRDAEDPNESGLTRPGDHKVVQVYSGRKLAWLAYQSIGVIYGDIGTSPLYVFSSVFGDTPPARDDLIGALSLILWSLIVMVTLKYVIIILRADNDGEGGTFSTYSLLSRYANITNRDPRDEPLLAVKRYDTDDYGAGNLKVRNTLERSKFLKGLLKIVGVLAVTMVMSDGVLTPAQSVLGAVQGLNVIVPSITNATIVGTTCGILVLLFIIQPFGTTKIGAVFAPVLILWLALLAAFGVYNLVLFDWRVLKAFNPGEAFTYLIRNKHNGWLSLGGILLSFTGVEAMFADLGAFSRRAIQISWLGFCLPCLLLTYLGQAAYIAVHPEAYAYPVFYTAPPHCLILIMVVAVLAAIVASQAIITATFQLLSQIVKLSYFPAVQIVHTSLVFHDQLYVPLANYLLLVGTVAVTAAYQNTTALGNAYGVCVAFVTFFDTCMVSLAAIIVWRLPPYVVVLPWLAIASMDGAFLSSALTKVPSGGWFTLTLAAVLAVVLINWRFGKEQQWTAEKEDRKPLPSFINVDEDGIVRLRSQRSEKGGEPLSIVKGFGIFFDKGGINTPMVFSQFISKLVSVPEVIVFFHMRPLERPTVEAHERFFVSQVKALPNCYRVICRHGFMDVVITADLAAVIYGHVRNYVLDKNRPGAAVNEHAQPTRAPITPADIRVIHDVKDAGDLEKISEPDSPQETENSEDLTLAQLQGAYEHRVLYVIGKEEMHVKPATPIWRKVLLKTFLFMRDNTRNKMANLKVPTDRLVEIGFVKDV